MLTLNPATMKRTKAEEKVLGTDTDEAIGLKLGRDKDTVGDRQLRIPPSVPEWTPYETKLLGTIPDRLLVKKLGRSLFSLQNQRLTCTCRGQSRMAVSQGPRFSPDFAALFQWNELRTQAKRDRGVLHPSVLVLMTAERLTKFSNYVIL